MSVVARRKQTITEMLPEPCLINICYACAAFFRRSANAWKAYKCQSHTKNCDLTTQKRPLCRLCRYNRCVELNLKTCNNDPTCFEVTQKTDDTDPWNVVDMFHQINVAFKKQSSRIADNSDPFTNFSSVLLNLIEAAKPKSQLVPVKPLSGKSKAVRAWFQKNVALNTAKLLTCCPHFQQLPFEEKVCY
uniref:Nuclear receptor domain-containing protein n=1 Tax=Panagrolaimus superbus TaxID=310955 RepID=A0A914Y5V1_9BILA